MTGHFLKSIDINNFRSIRGPIHAPLDAKVILVHGENGAGKTSLLSAIELSLTGEIQSLERADKGYKRQLLHKGTDGGQITTKFQNSSSHFTTKIDSSGVDVKEMMGSIERSFFSDRCYLPQSLLSELLNIYQDSNSEIDSPLSEFVSELIGLDRLDAIEAGLEAVADIRNLRKVAKPLNAIEVTQKSLKSQIRKSKDSLQQIFERKLETLEILKDSYKSLSLDKIFDSKNLEVEKLKEIIEGVSFESQLSKLSLDLSRLETLIQEYERVIGTENDNLNGVKLAHTKATVTQENWKIAHQDELMTLNNDIVNYNPDLQVTSRDPIETVLSALQSISDASSRSGSRVLQAISLRKEIRKLEEDIATLQPQMKSLATEKKKLSTNSDTFGRALSEVSPFIHDENCPVCNRDYSELNSGTLSTHLNSKIRDLLNNHNRIVEIGEQQIGVNRAIAEKTERKRYLQSESLNEELFAELERESVSLSALRIKLEKFEPIALKGREYFDRETGLRQRISKVQSDSLAKLSIRKTLSDFAGERLSGFKFDSSSTPNSIISELQKGLTNQEHILRQKLDQRNRCEQFIEKLSSDINVENTTRKELSVFESDLVRVNARLEAASKIRDDGKKIISTVTKIRSETISHVFNRNLNSLWRDLFVRLAPSEPFIPAFHIPEKAARKIVPKLVTILRNGKEGGTPGAMLSAGNLNTAALTLFLALHLTVKPVLPWLILDDPVQSMDDIHISHLASLLRTLSKEQDRQIMIAVHDRQLFDYLALELSPAFSDDSLLLLELYRAQNGNTRCVSSRVAYKKETALRVVA